MYGEKAIAQRRCVDTRADGQPCRGWALWDDSGQHCLAHSERRHTGPIRNLFDRQQPSPTRYVPCTCIAYSWPHRPGSGLCRWPDPPIFSSATSAGTRYNRFRRRNGRVVPR